MDVVTLLTSALAALLTGAGPILSKRIQKAVVVLVEPDIGQGGAAGSPWARLVAAVRVLREGTSQDRQGNGRLAQRSDAILEQLRNSASVTQQLLDEMETLARDRVAKVEEVERRISDLANEEESLAARLQRLRELEPEAMRDIAAVLGLELKANDRQGRRRDYLLFALGVGATVLMTFVGALLSDARP